MNPIHEEAFLFDSDDGRLVGIITTPGDGADDARGTAGLGVLIVVGGPQYRVGSHRQFVLLARALAARGFAVMRFDCGGMGDSTGTARSFTDRDADIRAATDAFIARRPHVGEVAIWGLCDAASAALLYAPGDPRIRHLVLLNPWVRTEAGLARTHLKHYYTRRLFDGTFWTNLLRGRVGILRALRGFASTLLATRARSNASDDDRDLPFQIRMARGWRRFDGDILLICAGDDLTAKEFIDHAARDIEWLGLLDDAKLARCNLIDADHTFSRAEWRDRVAQETADWLARRTMPSGRDRRSLESSDRGGVTQAVV